MEALFQKSIADNPEAASNPFSRWKQRQRRSKSSMRLQNLPAVQQLGQNPQAGLRKEQRRQPEEPVQYWNG